MSPLNIHAFNQFLDRVLDTDLGGEDAGVNKAWSLSPSRSPSSGGAEGVKAVTIQKDGVREPEKGDLDQPGG